MIETAIKQIKENDGYLGWADYEFDTVYGKLQFRGKLFHIDGDKRFFLTDKNEIVEIDYRVLGHAKYKPLDHIPAKEYSVFNDIHLKD